MNFYVLGPSNQFRPGCLYGDPNQRHFASANWASGVGWNYESCPRGHLKARQRADILKISFSKVPRQDLAWTSQGMSELLCTMQVGKLLQELFTGIELRSITIVGKHLASQEWIEARPRGKASLDLTASGIVYQNSPCDICGAVDWIKEGDGLVINQASWDGSDFFTVDEFPFFIFVTERVAHFIKLAYLAPCVLTAAEDYPMDSGMSAEERRVNDIDRLVRRGVPVEAATKIVNLIYGDWHRSIAMAAGEKF